MFRIVLYSPDQKTAQATADAAFQRVQELDACMSDYRSDSELMRLCSGAKPGVAIGISEDLATILKKATEVSRMSGGAFDVTVGPIVRLWRKARRLRRLPSPASLEQALANVGHQYLKVGESEDGSFTATLMKPGLRLDLGGIAKGFAADQALRVLKKRGFGRALVDAGGDLVLGNPPPDLDTWSIEVSEQRPESGAPGPETAKAEAPLRIANRAVASSGDIYQGLDIGGRRWSHIVNPKTGLGLTHRTQVTVVAQDGTTADALASALSVMELARGLRLVEGLAGVEALWVVGATLESPAVKRFKSSGFSALSQTKKTSKTSR